MAMASQSTSISYYLHPISARLYYNMILPPALSENGTAIFLSCFNYWLGSGLFFFFPKAIPVEQGNITTRGLSLTLSPSHLFEPGSLLLWRTVSLLN